MIAIDAHWMSVRPELVATGAVKTVRSTVMAIPPYKRTDRLPTRSTVKYNGTQPSVKKMLRTLDRRETSDGFATVERMTLPAGCQYINKKV